MTCLSRSSEPGSRARLVTWPLSFLPRACLFSSPPRIAVVHISILLFFAPSSPLPLPLTPLLSPLTQSLNSLLLPACLLEDRTHCRPRIAPPFLFPLPAQDGHSASELCRIALETLICLLWTISALFTLIYHLLLSLLLYLCFLFPPRCHWCHTSYLLTTCLPPERCPPSCFVSRYSPLLLFLCPFASDSTYFLSVTMRSCLSSWTLIRTNHFIA